MEEVVRTLLETKRVYCKLDSSTINYELEFDFFTKEFKGFTIFIDKNTYVNTEINGDHLLHCDQ